jgi:hypothetical protein
MIIGGYFRSGGIDGVDTVGVVEIIVASSPLLDGGMVVVDDGMMMPPSTCSPPAPVAEVTGAAVEVVLDWKMII